jgi:MerR family transcriptional regulator, light-induced transcriptional regulator
MASSRPPSSQAVHPIQVVTRRTGLSADVVRAWERRHAAIAPARSHGGRRLYSDADVERLRLLAKATLSGHTIGQVARLSDAELVALADVARGADLRGGTAAPASGPAGDAPTAAIDDVERELREAALASVERYDAAQLDLHLRRAIATLSAGAFLEAIVVPLAVQMEQRVREGTLRAAQQVLGLVAFRRVLDDLIVTTTWSLAGPPLVVATLSGQPHELGALVTAVAAALEGWRVTYVGPGLPAEDIVDAVLGVGAPAVMLSLGTVANGRTIPRELRRLRTLLPADVVILVEGAAAVAHDHVLSEIDAVVAHDLRALRRELRARVAG